jgi:predicted NBD/HSP70 family sugar kinase
MRELDRPVLVTAGVDQAALRGAQLGLVLRSLRDRGPRSRARLASDLGMTRAAVSGLVAELHERGLVRDGSRQRGGVGRPGTTVELDGRRVCGVGAEVNVDHIATMALDLAGAVVSERRTGLDTRRLTAEQVVDELAGMLAQTLTDVAAVDVAVTGITVGVAGLVDSPTQTVTLAPNLGWSEFPLVALLHDRLHSRGRPTADLPPVWLDNESNLAATAELDPVDPDRRDMLLVFGEVGVGGGLVADGRLLRGRRGFAGEIGHLMVDPQGTRCGCGRIGCWETVIGLRALLQAATDADDPARDPGVPLEDRLDLLVQRAERGDARTLAALLELGGWLGRGAAALANALNPGVVVLGGYFAVLGAWLKPAVEEQLAAGVLAPGAGGTRVVLSTLGPTAAVRGGARVSLDPVFTDPTVIPRREATSEPEPELARNGELR